METYDQTADAELDPSTIVAPPETPESSPITDAELNALLNPNTNSEETVFDPTTEPLPEVDVTHPTAHNVGPSHHLAPDEILEGMIQRRGADDYTVKYTRSTSKT